MKISKSKRARPQFEVTIVYRKLGRERARGQWLESALTIEIDPRLKGEEHLEVLIHESLHCLLDFLSEEAVDAYAKNMARLVYADGYRKAESIEL